MLKFFLKNNGIALKPLLILFKHGIVNLIQIDIIDNGLNKLTDTSK